MRPKVNLVVLDPGSGKARPGSWVTFYHSNTQDKPALYADDDIVPLPNPVQANALGQVAVRIGTGTYDVSMSWDGAQPTVVEDVLAWTPESDVITSPGDLIIGDVNGENARLAVGANGQALIVENGLPKWSVLGAGRGMPTGNPGALLGYGLNGDLSSINPGVQDQALVMQGGLPSWATILAAGQLLPINQPGDLVVGSAPSGTPTRLPRGNPGDSLTVEDSGAIAWRVGGEVSFGRGDCYLDFESPTILRLIRHQGSELWVAGRSRTIPFDGLVMSQAGLAVSTFYYIYAVWNGTDLVLQASQTGPQFFGGLACMLGDSTKTLVGMAYSGFTGLEWSDEPKHRLVLSYFNPSPRLAECYFSAPRSISSTSVVEIHPEIRCQFLTWGDAYFPTQAPSIAIEVSGHVSMPPGSALSTYLVMDGQAQSGVFINNQTASEILASVNQTRTVQPTVAGYHYITLWGQSFTGQTHTYQGDVNAVTATRIRAALWG